MPKKKKINQFSRRKKL